MSGGRIEAMQPSAPIGKLGSQSRRYPSGHYSYRETVVRGRTYRSYFISDIPELNKHESKSSEDSSKQSGTYSHSDSGCDSESSSIGDSVNEATASCSENSGSPCSIDVNKDDDQSVDGDSHSENSVCDQSEKSDKELEVSNLEGSDEIGESGSKPTSQRKYYTWGPYKLLKPIKDIPPRFQQLLAESNAQKARCEGIPLVYQCDPYQSYPPAPYDAPAVAWGEGEQAEFQLNPAAPDFTPSHAAKDFAGGEVSFGAGNSSSSQVTTPGGGATTCTVVNASVYSDACYSHGNSSCTTVFPPHLATAPPPPPPPPPPTQISHLPPSVSVPPTLPPPPLPPSASATCSMPAEGAPSCYHQNTLQFYPSTPPHYPPFPDTHFAPPGDGAKTTYCYHTVHASPAGYGNGCPVPSTAVPCTTSGNNSNSSGVIYFTHQPYPAQPVMGYNYGVPYPAQQSQVPGPPQQAHCISQYTVYGHSQPQ